MGRFTKGLVLTLSVAVFLYVGLGFVLGQTQNKPYRSLTVFTEVLHHIQQDYVEEPNIPLVTNGALHGLLEALDPESSYLGPREFAEYKKQVANPPKGETGIALSKRFGYVAVVSVLPESPAAKAGVRAGDIFENISGFTTREMSLGQARLLLAGEPGASVRVTSLRQGRAEPQELDIVRGAPGSNALIAERLHGDPASNSAETAVAYLRVPALVPGKAEELRARLQQIERAGVRRLILDMRDCAMGEISEGVAAARLFLSAGAIVSLRGQTVARQEFAADPAKVAWKHALTVLTSDGTAGAAEVLAAAIAENKRGSTVGDRTWGAASEQKLIPLEDGAALMLTVANYYSPSGKSIPAEGVAPTVRVVQRHSDEGRLPVAEDPVVRKAIELLMKPATPAPQPAAASVTPVRPLPARSFALREAA